MLVSVAVAVAPDDGGAAPDPPLESREAAAAFRRAWRRSLEGTYAVTWRFRREVASGRAVDYEVRLAQRPPSRLRVGGGVVEWRDASRARACGVGPDGTRRCRDGPAPPYEQQVTADLARLAPYVSGARALYGVRVAGEGCFELRLRAPLPGALYGRRARFCFDRASGAVVRSVVRRPEATDSYVAVALRRSVGPGGLEPPAPPPAAGDRGG